MKLSNTLPTLTAAVTALHLLLGAGCAITRPLSKAELKLPAGPTPERKQLVRAAVKEAVNAKTQKCVPYEGGTGFIGSGIPESVVEQLRYEAVLHHVEKNLGEQIIDLFHYNIELRYSTDKNVVVLTQQGNIYQLGLGSVNVAIDPAELDKSTGEKIRCANVFTRRPTNLSIIRSVDYKRFNRCHWTADGEICGTRIFYDIKNDVEKEREQRQRR
jgi:hypothetical protein